MFQISNINKITEPGPASRGAGPNENNFDKTEDPTFAGLGFKFIENNLERISMRQINLEKT